VPKAPVQRPTKALRCDEEFDELCGTSGTAATAAIR
jgi:hypothetical protein